MTQLHRASQRQVTTRKDGLDAHPQQRHKWATEPATTRGRAFATALAALLVALVASLLIMGDSRIGHTQSGPDLGRLAVYWLDDSGNTHPQANGDILQKQFCAADPTNFTAVIYGDTDHSLIDEWEADFRRGSGVVANSITHQFREHQPGMDGMYRLYGRVTMSGPATFSLRSGPGSATTGDHGRSVPL